MTDIDKGSREILQNLHVHGSGTIDGPLQIGSFVTLRSYDPVTTLWGMDEAGRMWFNVTTGELKYWDGTVVKVVTAT